MTSCAPVISSIKTRTRVDFGQRPMLVFWETTRACLLACRHCRASATMQAPPGELSEAEGRRLIEQVAGFGRPHPILVLTGGDCLLRPDLFDLVEFAVSLGVPVCLSPSVTPLLTPQMISRIADCGAKAVSVSLDGARAATHDGVRGVPGHFDRTVEAIRALLAAGVTVQVNTTVMRVNVLSSRTSPPCWPRPARTCGRSSSWFTSVAARRPTPSLRPRAGTSATSCTTHRSTASSPGRSRRRSSAGRWRAAGPESRHRGLRCTGGSRGAWTICLALRPVRRARTPRRPATARASCSSPTTARSIRRAFSRWGWATCAAGRCRRSTGTIRCCRPSAPRSSPAPAAAAMTLTCAADHGPARTPPAATRSGRTPGARISRVPGDRPR